MNIFFLEIQYSFSRRCRKKVWCFKWWNEKIGLSISLIVGSIISHLMYFCTESLCLIKYKKIYVFW